MAVNGLIVFNGANTDGIFYGNIPVDAVYYGNVLVWEKVFSLIMGDERWVCIEYEAKLTENVSSISVFLDRTTNDGVMWIMEDNHCVAKSTTQGSNATEIYGCQGYLRTHTFSNLKFYEGHTYYICWKHGQWASTSSTPDYFAYYQGEVGNYKKICVDGNIDTLVSDCGLYEYMGELSSMDWDTVMKYESGKAFYSSTFNYDAVSGRTSSYPISSTDPSVALYVGQVDNSSEEDESERQNNLYTKFFTMRSNDVMFDKEASDNSCKFYKRTSNYQSASNVYRGKLTSGESLSVVDLNNIFYWKGGYQSSGFNDNTLYIANVSLIGFLGFVDDNFFNGLSSPVQKMAKLYMLIGNTPGKLFAYMSYNDIGGDYSGYFQRENVYKAVNNSNNHITSLTPITQEPTSGIGWLGIYYKGATTAADGWLDSGGNPITKEAIVINTSSSSTPVWEVATSLSNIFEHYKDSNNNNVTTNNMASSVAFGDVASDSTGDVKNAAFSKISAVTTATLEFKNTSVDSSHKKFYLKVNNREV